MKELPETKILLELLELAKDAEQKARELYEIGEKFGQKWEHQLKERHKTIGQKQKNI